jgi:hypothetical protein
VGMEMSYREMDKGFAPKAKVAIPKWGRGAPHAIGGGE